MHNSRPTSHILYDQKIASAPTCPRYGHCSESILHAILECGPAKEVWHRLGLNWVTKTTLNNFWDWVCYIFQTNRAGTCSRISITMWSMWCARNKHVMEGKQQIINETKTKIESFLLEMIVIKEKLPIK